MQKRRSRQVAAHNPTLEVGRRVGGAARVDNDRRRRQSRRNQDLLDAVARVDTSTDPRQRKELADWIQDRYDEQIGGELMGLFARCHLGPPFVDHEITPAGGILRHFTPTDAIPPEYLAARALARSAAYLYIEVWSDGQLVPIRNDGTPAA